MYRLIFSGEELRIDENVKVVPTPGHTLSDVTVLVISKQATTVAIVGKYLLKNQLYVFDFKACIKLVDMLKFKEPFHTVLIGIINQVT